MKDKKRWEQKFCWTASQIEIINKGKSIKKQKIKRKKMNTSDNFFCTKLMCDSDQTYIHSTYCKISNCKASDCKIYYFTHGQCAAFAIALHKEFGHPLFGIYVDWTLTDYRDEFSPPKKTVHAFCRNPRDGNTVIDARGVKPLTYVLNDIYHDTYSEKDLHEFTENELMIVGNTGGVKDSEIERAQLFINLNSVVF